MKKIQLLLVVLLLFLAGCSSTPAPTPKDSNAMPLWVMQPNQNGKIGAVGIAGRTYDQSISTQRKLAITRALDELSLQQNVKVSLQMSKDESVVNSKSSMTTKEHSTYKSDTRITAHINAIWNDRVNHEFYVYLVLDK